MVRRWIAVLVIAPFLVTGTTACVSRTQYDETVKSADQVRAELAKRIRDDAAERSRLQQRLAELEAGRASMQKQLNGATAATTPAEAARDALRSARVHTSPRRRMTQGVLARRPLCS
jgi:septal ring factor EnvC (AmiA/AmiB activator)